MHITPTILFGVALIAYALARLPDKFKPDWTHRLNGWQKLIGLVAVVAAILIIMNPEFYALGVLGDSAFFDLLVLGISLQLQTYGSRIFGWLATAFFKARRFATLRLYTTCMILLLVLDDTVCAIQKIVHRISS